MTRAHSVGITILIAVPLLLSSAALAQDATPSAPAAVSPGAASPPSDDAVDDAGPVYQATLRTGTCDELGEVAAVLAELLPAGATDDEAEPTLVGPRPAQPVRTSVSEVPTALTDIAEAGHAVVVGPDMESVLLCGTVGGPLDSDEELSVALSGERDDLLGLALLSALGIEATRVHVFLIDPDERSSEPEESPGPSPSPDAEGYVEPDPDEPGPDPDPDVDPGEDIDEDVSR